VSYEHVLPFCLIVHTLGAVVAVTICLIVHTLGAVVVVTILFDCSHIRGRRGRDRMVVGFTNTFAICAYHH
jgi:hypothetical protein